MTVQSIRFPAQFHDGRRNECSIAEFKLGPGPCGKTVVQLDYEPTDIGVTISQYHDDGTAKSFGYQWRDITGRIELDHK